MQAMTGDRPLSKFLPLSLGGLSTLIASIQDINYGAIAGGITVLGVAVGASIWQVASSKTRAFVASEAAKLDAMKASKAEELSIYERAEAAKLKVFREAEQARIQLQHEADAANKDSLSTQLAGLQRSMDEANRTLHDAREANATLREMLDDARRRIEEANEKGHRLLNVANDEKVARELSTLEHQREKAEIESKYAESRKAFEDAHAEVVKLQVENAALTTRVSEMLAATKLQVDSNTARIDVLSTGGPA